MGVPNADNNPTGYTWVGVPYKVRQGDTLTSISKATGIAIWDLQNDNSIKDPNKIRIGEVIVLNYHPPKEEAFNSEEMNEMYPNLNDQAAYFEQVDAEMLQRYNQVAEEGAQAYNAKHLNIKS